MEPSLPPPMIRTNNMHPSDAVVNYSSAPNNINANEQQQQQQQIVPFGQSLPDSNQAHQLVHQQQQQNPSTHYTYQQQQQLQGSFGSPNSQQAHTNQYQNINNNSNSNPMAFHPPSVSNQSSPSISNQRLDIEQGSIHSFANQSSHNSNVSTNTHINNTQNSHHNYYPQQSQQLQQLPPPPEAILYRLKLQIEHYFSVQNLVHDDYLLQQIMSSGGQSLPCALIASFPRVRSILQDHQDILTGGGNNNNNNKVDYPPFSLMQQALEASVVVRVQGDSLIAWNDNLQQALHIRHHGWAPLPPPQVFPAPQHCPAPNQHQNNKHAGGTALVQRISPTTVSTEVSTDVSSAVPGVHHTDSFSSPTGADGSRKHFQENPRNNQNNSDGPPQQFSNGLPQQFSNESFAVPSNTSNTDNREHGSSTDVQHEPNFQPHAHQPEYQHPNEYQHVHHSAPSQQQSWNNYSSNQEQHGPHHQQHFVPSNNYYHPQQQDLHHEYPLQSFHPPAYPTDADGQYGATDSQGQGVQQYDLQGEGGEEIPSGYMIVAAPESSGNLHGEGEDLNQGYGNDNDAGNDFENTESSVYDPDHSTHHKGGNKNKRYGGRAGHPRGNKWGHKGFRHQKESRHQEEWSPSWEVDSSTVSYSAAAMNAGGPPRKEDKRTVKGEVPEPQKVMKARKKSFHKPQEEHSQASENQQKKNNNKTSFSQDKKDSTTNKGNNSIVKTKAKKHSCCRRQSRNDQNTNQGNNDADGHQFVPDDFPALDKNASSNTKGGKKTKKKNLPAITASKSEDGEGSSSSSVASTKAKSKNKKKQKNKNYMKRKQQNRDAHKSGQDLTEKMQSLTVQGTADDNEKSSS